MSHSHFKSFQRNELAVLLRAGFKQNKIAELLGKTASAVCQELKRNGADNKSGYDVGLAKKMTEQRRVTANKRFKKIENNQWLRIYVIRNIKKYWSPEQISGRIKEKWPNDKSRQFSKDSIYNYIYSHQKKLVKYLRCQKGKYRRRHGTRIRVEQQLEAKKKRITERKTGISIYFAFPYHSWERGTNENCNGLLRQFFPKKSAFAMITQEAINEACDFINNRPRKRLGYLTPNEVFNGK